MKKLISILLLFSYTISNAQESIYLFPEEQIPYIGGYEQFYKDFNKILMDKNISPCENQGEFYEFAVLINPESKISFVADPEDYNDKNSKCAKDASREVAKYLTGWNPAMIEGKKVSAVAKFVIIPDQLFGKLEDGYNAVKNKEETLPEFPGGINAFRTEVVNNVDLSRFKYNQAFRLEVTFVVERDGTVQDVKLAQSSGNKQFDNMVIRAFIRVKVKWKPATIYKQNVRYRFRMPLAFQTENQ